ncbi:MAG: T9SS type A sorting domain-containing protein, partial [Clostridia bacterium]|nr:T9SS type A sorting domain-containing protein [Clostridia bacterium]
VTDNCGIESLSGNYEPGTFFPVGLTDVVYTATDIAGNQSYDGFTVTVFDTDPPDVSCPGDMTVSQSSPPFTLSGATPEGGTYEGSGVSGGVFYPADAGVGSHQINYLYLNPSSGCAYGCAFTIHVTGGAAQIIQIPEGWSGISSFIQPEPPLIDLVLSPIIDQLIMLYNFDGMFYPGQNINTLGEWDVHSGYVVKVTDDVLLTINGDETPDKTIFVNEGWTIIPVLSSNPVFAEMLFGGLDQLVIVKDVAGPGVYWPQFGINTLGFVEPGKSYFVLMNAPATINFGTASTKSHYDGKPAELINSPWNAVVPGPASHVVAFRLVENVFQNGDIIGGFNADGACTGLVQLTDSNAPFALTVFGNTAFARLTNGLEPGEVISYKFYRPSTGETFALEVRYNTAMNTGTFENNGLSEVKSVKLAPVSVSELSPLKVSIYPNPNDGTFTIDGNGEQVELEIFDAFGEQVYSSDAMLPHKVDLSQQAGGVYFIKLTSTKGGYYGKVIIK